MSMILDPFSWAEAILLEGQSKTIQETQNVLGRESEDIRIIKFVSHEGIVKPLFRLNTKFQEIEVLNIADYFQSESDLDVVGKVDYLLAFAKAVIHLSKHFKIV